VPKWKNTYFHERSLTQSKAAFKARLKDTYLGLLTLERMRARQRSRLTNIKCGHANSKLFYLRANGRKRKKHIMILCTPHGIAITHEDKEVKIAHHFNGLWGSKLSRSVTLN
jgi:hypothetical protein